MKCLPIVSIITPTTPDRQAFNDRITLIAQRQTSPVLEHLFDYGPETIGEKLNRLCARATGDVIMRFDSDDYYACDWVERMVEVMVREPGYDIYGLKDLYYTGGWKYTGGQDNYMVWGATMAIRKEYWRRRKWPEINCGEDSTYCRGARVKSVGYVDGFLATIHDGNTSRKKTDRPRWSRVLTPNR